MSTAAVPQPVIRTGSSLGTGDVIVSKIDRKHREWHFYISTWELIDILYQGGAKLRANVDSVITRRPKELYDVFYERVRRLTYQNIIQSCISWHLSKMFETQPTVDGNTEKSDFTEFIDNCDRCGTSFNSYSRSMLETMMLYRRSFTLVDLPRREGNLVVQTKYQEEQLGLNIPYLVKFDPRQVINWAMDKFGNLKWLVVKTVEVTQDDPLGEIEVATNWWIFDRLTVRQYQWKPEKVQDTDVNEFFNHNRQLDNAAMSSVANLVHEGPHALSDYGVVPFVVTELPMDLWHANRAFLHLLEHVDTMNAYSWKLFMANLPVLTIYSETEQQAKTISETGYIQVGQNDKIEWLEPRGSSFQESRMHLGNTRQEIYREFHLQAQAKDATASADASSGYSKEVEMAPAVDVLNALGDIEREGMQNILCMVKLAANMDVDKKPDVNGFQFETKPTLKLIAKYQAATDAGIIQKSETLERTVAVDIAMDLVDGKNESLKETIRTEIMASPPTPIEVGPDAKTGPGAQITEFQQRDMRTRALDTVKDIGGKTD